MSTITVFTNSGSGLANRLIAVGEALWLAKLTNRTVQLFWVHSPLCAMTFQGFFQSLGLEKVFEHTDETKFSGLDNLILRSKKATLLSDTPDICNSFSGRPNCTVIPYQGGVRKQEILALEGDLIFDESCGIVNDKSAADYRSVFSYCSQLRLKEHIQLQVLNLWKQYSQPSCPIVGLHIRRQPDDQHWDAVFSKSPVETYIGIAQRLVELVPNIKFFIATLDNAIEAEFRNTFGGRVISYAKIKWDRHSTEGMLEAVIELYLLAQCDYLLLNNNSTYGWLAQALGDKKGLLINEVANVNTAAEQILSSLNLATTDSLTTGNILVNILTLETGKRVTGNQQINAWTSNLLGGERGLPVYYDPTKKTFACKLEKQRKEEILIIAIPVVPPSWATIDITNDFSSLYLEFNAKVEEIETGAGLLAKISMGEKDYETRLTFSVDNDYKLTNQWTKISIPIRYFAHEVGDTTRRDLRTVQFILISDNVVHLSDIKLVSKVLK